MNIYSLLLFNNDSNSDTETSNDFMVVDNKMTWKKASWTTSTYAMSQHAPNETDEKTKIIIEGNRCPDRDLKRGCTAKMPETLRLKTTKDDDSSHRMH